MLWLFIILYSITGLYLLLNFKRDIHAFQQNSYRLSRYWRWLRAGHLLPAWRLTDLALLLMLLTPFVWVSIIVIPITLTVKCLLILKAKYKKPLVFTKRVWRLYTCTGLLAAAAYALSIIFWRTGNVGPLQNPYFDASWFNPAYVALIITTVSWAVVMLASVLLAPVEKLINRRYYNDAKRLLASMPDMKIIGITGSFGKTSTKHFLHRILSEKYETLMTPGSFNTPMGVIRTVREQLKPYHEIFICEMGAKQKGDIKEICDLVSPHMGIITAVGPMHLETFGNIDTVQATKFELADALPSSGLILINDDFEYCKNRKVSNVPSLRYSVEPEAKEDYTVTDLHCDAHGSRFTLHGPEGYALELTTTLIGDSNISNLVAAVAMARHLGVSDSQIKAAVARIEQVEHRLSMKRTPGGITIIDDAYNSNPIGSRMALEALARFEGRKIVVTPGMIELGDKQYELNRDLGRNIARNVDVAIIVGQYNREAILEGIKEEGRLNESQIIVVDSFADSQKYLAANMRKDDFILYENDLPDTFK